MAFVNLLMAWVTPAHYSLLAPRAVAITETLLNHKINL